MITAFHKINPFAISAHGPYCNQPTLCNLIPPSLKRQGGRVGKSISPKFRFSSLFLFNVSLVILLAGVCNQRGASPLATSTPSCYSSLACFPGRLNCTTAPRGGDDKTTFPLPLRIPIRHSQTTISFCYSSRILALFSTLLSH